MARIRSIHPGLFTDEAFVALSAMARVLLLGIWTEADDHGVFDWKPVTLKMRILPADNADVQALLGELQAVQAIGKVTFAGKDYGLVRNFCRFQRPKSPSYRVPVPEEYWNYIGLSSDGSVPNHQSSPSTTPGLPQPSPSPVPEGEKDTGNPSSEGGGRREKKEEEESKNPLASLAGAAREVPSDPVPDAKPKGKPRVEVNSNEPEKPRRRKVPIPPGWKPTEAHRAQCVAEGHDPDDMEAHFRDVCQSNGYIYLDHDAGYRNFIRNQKNFKRGTNVVRQNGTPQRGSIVRAADDALTNLEREESRLRREIEADNQMREAAIPKLSQH